MRRYGVALDGTTVMVYAAPAPVFIHGFYRSGSTYLLNAFRVANQGYWCYKEPSHELLLHLNGEADRILEIGSDAGRGLRHPALSKPYFWEFHEVKDSLAGLFRKSFSYDDFFMHPGAALPEDQTRYFGALIKHAKGRPVLQFCRSAGRIGAMQQVYGGMHIHLWREPRNQWWSFKVNDYFDPAAQLIYNARELPPVLQAAKRRCDIAEFHSDDVQAEFAHARRHPLRSADNYFAFYALWLYAYLEGERHCQLTVSIDRLSSEQQYRDETLRKAAEAGLGELNFSDCSVPQTELTDREKAFFAAIEREVRDLFARSGFDGASLAKAAEAHQGVAAQGVPAPAEVLRAAERSREMVLRYLDQLVETEALAAQEAERAREARRAVEALLASHSWRITAPLR